MKPDHVCLTCGYDLSGTPDDPAGGWLCPECGRLNVPGDYYLALQQIMPRWAWLVTVACLTLLNVTLCVGGLSLGYGVGVVIAVGPAASLIESALACSIAGHRAHSQVRGEKMMMLAGALCCFTFVGTLLAVGVVMTLWVGHF
jgi:hypothetical protein